MTRSTTTRRKEALIHELERLAMGCSTLASVLAHQDGLPRDLQARLRALDQQMASLFERPSPT